MKTNPKILTLVVTLIALPVAAFANTATDAVQMAAHQRIASVQQTQTDPTPVRFNLVDGQPIR